MCLRFSESHECLCIYAEGALSHTQRQPKISPSVRNLDPFPPFLAQGPPRGSKPVAGDYVAFHVQIVSNSDGGLGVKCPNCERVSSSLSH